MSSAVLLKHAVLAEEKSSSTGRLTSVTKALLIRTTYRREKNSLPSLKPVFHGVFPATRFAAGRSFGCANAASFFAWMNPTLP
jgi:hypothetical protein